jgi:hypothetical protein
MYRFGSLQAHFMVRQPRGLIAAALQYGHVSTKVTLSYAGRADTSWLDDLALEQLEMVLDQAGQDMAGLRDGEHVSGPSADEYRARVERAAAFAGRTVTGVRSAARLLASADPDIHHGEAMTYVWRAETAACRAARLAAGLPGGDAPDESECRSSCANLAHRPRHRRPARARRPPGGCGGGPAVPGAAAGPRRGPGRPRPGRHRPSRPQPRRGYGTRTGGSHVSRAARRDRDAERAAIRAQPGACWPGPRSARRRGS